jgi:hypothetical protein
VNTDDIELAAQAITEESSADAVAGMLDRLKVVQEFAARFKQIVHAVAIAWIEHNGHLVIGDVRHYVGDNRTTKCPAPSKTLDALLTATGGDMEKVAGLLASDPFKHGACREYLGGQWDDHFIVEVKPKLLEGKPVKQLQSINTHFVRAAR